MEHQDKNAKFKLLKENMEFFKYMLENYKKEFIGEYINLLSTATNNYYTSTMHAFIDFMFKNNIEGEVLGQDFIEIKTDNNDETNGDRKELLRPMTAICKLVEPYYVLKYMVTTYSDRIANLGRDTLQKNIYDLKIYHKSLKDKDDKNGLGEIINQLENMLLKYKLNNNLPTKTNPNEDKVLKI